MNTELKKHINRFLPDIDQILAEKNIPIDQRLLLAGRLFVDIAVKKTSLNSKEEFLNSEIYRKVLLPLINEWYTKKYGDLSIGNSGAVYSGIVLVYNQPTLIHIPATISEIIENDRLAKLTFPDHLHSSENIETMFESKFDLDQMAHKKLQTLKDDIAKTVALSRSININLNMASNLQSFYQEMAGGIWSHFEKAIPDITSMKAELSSIACWDLHLAIEKTMKVLLNCKTGVAEKGHDLKDFAKKIKRLKLGVDFSKLAKLPSDKEAIKLRYVELKRTPLEAYHYYIIALNLVSDITSKLDQKLRINNSSITIEKVLWAK